MGTFKLFDNHYGETEWSFRDRYGADVQEKVARCYSNCGESDRCKNDCHFLVVDGIKHVDDDGSFPVFGMDCDVNVICWGGDDVNNSTIETHCRECAAAAHKFDVECEQREEFKRQQQSPEHGEHEALNRKQRTSSEYWTKLTDTEFEKQCSELFRDLV